MVNRIAVFCASNGAMTAAASGLMRFSVRCGAAVMVVKDGFVAKRGLNGNYGASCLLKCGLSHKNAFGLSVLVSIDNLYLFVFLLLYQLCVLLILSSGLCQTF